MPGDPGQRTEGLVDDPVAVVVLDEQGLRALPEHGTQGTRACGTHHGTGRVLRPVRDDQRPRPGRQRLPHVLDGRPLVVDAHGDHPQPERRHEVQQAAPPGILDGDGVTGLEVYGQEALDAVQRTGGDDNGPVRHTVGVEIRPCDARQLRLDGGVSVEHRGPVALLTGRRERRRQRGQQRRIGVAVRHVPHTGRHHHPDVLAPRGGRVGAHPAAAPTVGLDDPALTQRAVGGGDGIGIHPEPLRQLPHGRQQLTGFQLPGAHRAFDARGNLCCAPASDRILPSIQELCTSAI